MTVHLLPGLHPHSLATYLAALGLLRTVGRQRDPNLTAHWEGGALVVDSEVDDLARWLVEDYVPAPIVSPWNGGSGFGAKDKTPRAVLDRLVGAPGPRLAELRAAVELARLVADQAPAAGWDKARVITELRNRGPESLLGWLDACVVVRDDGPGFPPLLGTGGNDGRLDFSTNFHQRLLEVLPELGADPAASTAWAGDLLAGTGQARLVRGAIGQFDPGAAGGRNSSAFGDSESLVNPWGFVLLLEGALYFASGLARRQGGGPGRAAMPFCVYASPDGPNPGADGESSRGELWTPVWSIPLSEPEIGQLFVESRASWEGRTATQASHMYAALRSFGVARGLDRFVRYGLHQRNGLAFAAVRLDEVEVRADLHVRLAVEPERVMAPFGRVSAGPVRLARRRFERHHLEFVRTVRAEHLRDLLAEQTLADLAVMRSAGGRDDLGRRPALPRAFDYAAFLDAGLPHRREFRVAAALASVGYPAGPPRPVRPLRELLVGVMPIGQRDGWVEPTIRGLGVRPLVEVLADAVQWRARQPDHPGGVQRGFLPFPVRTVAARWADVHAWVDGRLDEAEMVRSFLACLALDWRGVPPGWTAAEPDAAVFPLPELALLQAFASGRVAAVDDPARGPDGVRYGLQADWPSRLRAERPSSSAAPSPVLGEAAGVLSRLGWSVTAPVRSPIPHDRLVAALVARSSVEPLRRLGVRPPSRAESATTDHRPDDLIDAGQGAHP